jgi:hypothetical protein
MTPSFIPQYSVGAHFLHGGFELQASSSLATSQAWRVSDSPRRCTSVHFVQHLLLYRSWAVRPISQLAHHCAKSGIRDVPAIPLFCRIRTTTRRLSAWPSAIVGATCRLIPVAPSARLRLSTIAPRSGD